MLGLDVIGISWGDVGDAGKAAFPYVHATGKGIASAFGAGAAADALENVERGQGWLPATPSPTASTVTTTVETTAKKAAPKAAAAAQTKATLAAGKKQSATASSDAAPPSQSRFGTGTLVVGVGAVGIIALIVHRLRGAH